MSEGVRQSRFAAGLARLRAEIGSGLVRDDGMLPGERLLAERLSVSRTTLRRMVAGLVAEGLLVHRQGVGTFVRGDAPGGMAGPPAEPPSPGCPLGGFTGAAARLGQTPSSIAVRIASGSPTPEEAMILACAPDDPVIRLDRIRCLDGTPVARESAVLPRWALAMPVTDGSLYAAMAAHGIVPARALQRMRIGLADSRDADALGCAVGFAIVRLRRADYLVDGRCCALTETVMAATRFDLLIETRAGIPPFGLVAEPQPLGA